MTLAPGPALHPHFPIKKLPQKKLTKGRKVLYLCRSHQFTTLSASKHAQGIDRHNDKAQGIRPKSQKILKSKYLCLEGEEGPITPAPEENPLTQPHRSEPSAGKSKDGLEGFHSFFRRKTAVTTASILYYSRAWPTKPLRVLSYPALHFLS